jgi:hypothetical protein
MVKYTRFVSENTRSIWKGKENTSADPDENGILQLALQWETQLTFFPTSLTHSVLFPSSFLLFGSPLILYFYLSPFLVDHLCSVSSRLYNVIEFPLYKPGKIAKCLKFTPPVKYRRFLPPGVIRQTGSFKVIKDVESRPNWQQSTQRFPWSTSVSLRKYQYISLKQVAITSFQIFN